MEGLLAAGAELVEAVGAPARGHLGLGVVRRRRAAAAAAAQRLVLLQVAGGLRRDTHRSVRCGAVNTRCGSIKPRTTRDNPATDLHKFIKACGLRVLLQRGATLVDLVVGGGGGQRLDARQHHPGLGQVSGQTAALPPPRAAGVLSNRDRWTH